MRVGEWPETVQPGMLFSPFYSYSSRKGLKKADSWAEYSNLVRATIL